MSQGRAYHTATLLPGGEVLVAGGLGVGAAGAELYNPSSGQWFATGSMAEARSHHAAALLGDGEVLVAGGVGSSGAELASTEIYNPATDTWRAAGNMNVPRAFAAATLLPVGAVLIAGGNEITSAAGHSAEVWSKGQWRLTGSMESERSGDTATLLPNGETLVFGGGPLAGGEYYNQGPGTWANTDGFGVAPPVQGQTETLLATGEVLVAGGVNRYKGINTLGHLYDPSTNRWQSSGAMNQARTQHTATRLYNGQVLVTGGEPAFSSTALAASELYNP